MLNSISTTDISAAPLNKEVHEFLFNKAYRSDTLQNGG